MATSLGKVGIVDRGNYLQEETYNAGDFVLYNGSTWLALKDGLLGAEPAEGTNWKYLARGFEAEVLSMIAANDTSGLIGEAGQQVNAQSLIDVIADKVANRLIDKGLIANNLVTDNTEMVLAAPMGKELKRQLDEQNNNMNIKMLDSVDVYTLQDGRYYVTNGVNMPPNHPHGYIFVNRILEDYAWVFYADPYNPDTTVAFNKQGAGTWLGWNMFVTNSDLKPIIGTSITNTIPSRKGTTVNRISNLSPGTYMIYGFAQYTTEFSETCNYSLYQDNNLISICRANSIGGGGQTPFGIVSFDTISNLEFNLYQSSNDTKEIVRSKLVAVRLN